MTSTQAICDELYTERIRQDKKWGPQMHSPPEWVSIIAEELGEASRQANWLHFPGPMKDSSDARAQLRRELIQAAACCIAFIEELDNGVAHVKREDAPFCAKPLNFKVEECYGASGSYWSAIDEDTGIVFACEREHDAHNAAVAMNAASEKTVDRCAAIARSWGMDHAACEMDTTP